MQGMALLIAVDQMILNSIAKEFKTVREISEELNLPFVRVSVRIKGMRKMNLVISVQSAGGVARGVKPLMYKKSVK